MSNKSTGVEASEMARFANTEYTDTGAINVVAIEIILSETCHNLIQKMINTFIGRRWYECV